MADPVTMVLSYPEFAGADPALIQAKMNEALRQVDLTIAGKLSDDYVYLLTAQKLAKSPMGNASKLSNTDGTTVYDAELDRIRRDVGSGYRLT